MAKRNLDRGRLGQHQDWYGNNAAVRCPVCGKVFIVSGFISKGIRQCPGCETSTANITAEEVTIEWPDAIDEPSVRTREALDEENRLDEFVDLVKGGGAITRQSIEHKLPKAETITFIERGGKMVAVAAIKRPSEQRASTITRLSGYQLPGDIPELGYVAVLCEWRGLHLAAKVVHKALSQFGTGALFATTSSPQIKSILNSHGFAKAGREYTGEDPSEMLSLWIREASKS